MSEWWRNIDVDTHMRLVDKHLEETLVDVDFILKNIPLNNNSKILDVACGNGRHSNALSQLGFEVYGLDYTRGLLKIANLHENRARFINGNMLNLPFAKGSFDLAISMWQSVGYFQEDKDNEAVFTGVSQVLKEGGYYLLQINNPLYTIVDMMNSGVIDSEGNLSNKHDQLIGKSIVEKTESFNLQTFRYVSRRSWKSESNPDHTEEAVHDMRYYSLPELNSILLSRGLRIENIFGSTSGEDFNLLSSQSLLIIRKVY